MSKTIIVGALGLIVSAAALGAGYVAGKPQPHQVTGVPVEAAPAAGAGRAEVEAIVRNYLLEHPELMIEVQAALEAKQQSQQQVAQQEAISSDADRIFNASYDGVIGNPDGKVTIVEFYDYNCGYCKRAMADMDAMVAADPDLRFVLKEFPILGPDSQKAHVVSMAFRAVKPEGYSEFHRRLMSSEGRASEETAVNLALELGADEAALRQEMQNPDILKAFSETYELADKLSITGTPSYVMGDEVVFGALGQKVLSEKVANLRACNSTNC